ncbi:MAG: ShlB/FhaC/HecB family hemolysin secretion/activation protein [Rhabdochlamydiaceae bacterium]
MPAKTPYYIFSQSIKILFFLTCVCGSPVHANPSIENKSEQESQKRIRGLFLTSQLSLILKEGRYDLSGLNFVDILIPGVQKDLEKILKVYLGKSINKDELINIKKEIIKFYRDNRHPAVVVEIPPQKSKGGVIQILITEQKLGEVIFKSQKWTTPSQLSKYLHVQKGQFIDHDVLKNDIAWLNRNPFHSASTKFKQGSGKDLIDVEVSVKDRFPFRPFTSLDNTGSSATGYHRIGSGVTWGNAFGFDDLLTYQYTTSERFSRLHSHSLVYLCYLPWQHVLNVSLNRTQVLPAIAGFRSVSKSRQTRFRYTIPFRPLFAKVSQELTLGMDVKRSNSNLQNLTLTNPQVALIAPPVIKDITISQFIFQYYFNWKDKKNNFWIDSQFVLAPFHFLKHQRDVDFSKNRAYARNRYAYYNITIGDVYKLPFNLSFASLLRWQHACRTLPSSELFGIGGYSTIRGYKPSEASGDQGVILNLEIRTQDFSPFEHLVKNKDRMSFLCFYDHGLSTVFKTRIAKANQMRDHATQYGQSIGMGLRYSINPFFSLRIDYGFKLHDMYSMTDQEKQSHTGKGAWHVGLSGSY